MVTYPKDWDEERLENVTSSIITGGTPSTNNPSFWGGTIPWLASTEIHQKRVNKPTTYITDVGLQNSSAKIAPEKSVLIALAGQGKTRGTAAFLQKNMAINQSLAALVVNGKADAEFLFYVMEENYDSLREVSSGDGGRGGLNKKLLKKFAVSIPSNVCEQKSIAETLSCMDEHIANLTELIEKKKGIRDGALEDLVSGRTRLKGVDIVWEETELGRISSYRKGRTSSQKKHYISTENMRQEFAGITPYSGSYTVDGCEFSEGDTLLANIRPYLKKIWYADFSGCCSADVLVVHPNDGIASKYIYYIVANDRYINYVMNGGTKGIKMPRGDKKFIMHYPVMIPTDEKIQQTLSDMLSSMDEEIIALEEEKDKMLQIKAGAMDDLLTGRIRLTRQGG
jgi:type I restriction enzyme S subunit